MKPESEIKELLLRLQATLPHLEQREAQGDSSAEIPLMVNSNAVILLMWILGQWPEDIHEFFGVNT
jgi:hypothetical protein